MTGIDIAHLRLHNQGISQSAFRKPNEVVGWLAAVQAQDYAAAKWALGLRVQDATDADLEQAFAEGSILRTHLLRPTWHFVTPADIRWMLALSAPRVHAANRSMYRRSELDQETRKRSNAALIKALQGGRQLTRDELREVLQRAGIATDGQFRMAYIMMQAELEGIVCSGARRGKQFTYALLDERAPGTGTLEREEDLAELARRYFASRGPATVQDFAWWSGLAAAEARSGLELVKSQLLGEVLDGQTYWLSPSAPVAREPSPSVHLLPNYDEYIVGYADRGAVFDASYIERLDLRGNILFTHTIVLDGRVVGTWKRTLRKREVVIETNTFTRLTKAEDQAVAAAARQYGKFLILPTMLPG